MNMIKGRLKRLISVVNDLEGFLQTRGEDFWAGKLNTIQNELSVVETLQSARLELDSCFAGMGSLNDLGFDSEADNLEFGRLADIVFRENKLLSSRFRERLRWFLYEKMQDEDELPPRIKNSFAR